MHSISDNLRNTAGSMLRVAGPLEILKNVQQTWRAQGYNPARFVEKIKDWVDRLRKKDQREELRWLDEALIKTTGGKVALNPEMELVVK